MIYPTGGILASPDCFFLEDWPPPTPLKSDAGRVATARHADALDDAPGFEFPPKPITAGWIGYASNNLQAAFTEGW